MTSYDVDGAMPQIVDIDAFNAATGGRYADDERLGYVLAAANDAVRSYCGWHVAPSIACTAHATADGRLVRLDATHVTSVDAVIIDGADITDECEWLRCGLIRSSKELPQRWQGVEVRYTAGVSVDAVAHVVVSLASKALNSQLGVTSESIGSASVSYEAGAASVSIGSAEEMALSPYRLVVTL